MSKLLNYSFKKIMLYAGIVLVCSIPVYYIAVSRLWKYELDEHNIILTPEAWREDRFLIIGAVTLLTILFFILLLGGFILINRDISRRLWKPFYKSLDNIRGFDLQQQKEMHFETTGIAEFNELNQSLQKLLSSNITAYKQQRDFADYASHELQTPLAIIQSKLELLLQSKHLTDEQFSIIEDTLTALARVSRINKNLLLLTRIENNQFMDKEKNDISIMLENTITLFNHFSESKELKLQTFILPGVIVEGNKILIEVVLNNIISNVIRHSPQQSTVSINLSANMLEVTNTGMTALKKDQLFKRFATASSQTPGTGLGLALVKQICDRYGWTIQYSFADNRHIFSLRF